MRFAIFQNQQVPCLQSTRPVRVQLPQPIRSGCSRSMDFTRRCSRNEARVCTGQRASRTRPRRYSLLSAVSSFAIPLPVARDRGDALPRWIFHLTILNDHVQYRMQNYSITEAARELGIQRATLYEWIRRKRVPAPRAQVISGVRFRFWTEEELKTLKRYKTEHYQKKPNRKRKRAVDNAK
jgi:excisionase family DNA binding protein